MGWGAGPPGPPPRPPARTWPWILGAVVTACAFATVAFLIATVGERTGPTGSSSRFPQVGRSMAVEVDDPPPNPGLDLTKVTPSRDQVAAIDEGVSWELTNQSTKRNEDGRWGCGDTDRPEWSAHWELFETSDTDPVHGLVTTRASDFEAPSRAEEELAVRADPEATDCVVRTLDFWAVEGGWRPGARTGLVDDVREDTGLGPTRLLLVHGPDGPDGPLAVVGWRQRGQYLFATVIYTSDGSFGLDQGRAVLDAMSHNLEP